MQYPGTLALVVGVSGSGKGALMAAAREAFPDAVFPVSCTTRAMRPGEAEGGTYFYISEEEFDTRIAVGDFLEWAPYGGHRYGTLKNQIIPALEAGKLVIREVEVQGVHQIKETLTGQVRLVTIFIHAGSWDLLRARIERRAPMSEEELLKRAERYEDEMAFQPEADVVIENREGALTEAQQRFTAVLREVAP